VKTIILGKLEPKGVAQHLKPIVHFFFNFFSPYDTLWVLIKDSIGIMGKKTHWCYENGMFTFVGILFFETPT
jgi:hypothetical protein